MERNELKEELEDFRQKLKTIEWDIKHNKVISKEAKYEEIKDKIKDLEEQLNQ